MSYPAIDVVNRFNPTLVRLRPPEHPEDPDPVIGFQSHAGSIEARTSPQSRRQRGGVSIPRWFD